MTAPLTITATWERSVIATGGTPVALHLALVPASHQTTRRPPLDLAFVIDRSGSMHGGRLDLVKQTLFGALGVLQPHDRIAVVIFDDHIETLLPLTSFTSATAQTLSARLAQVEARGSTNLSAGWLTGCQQLATALPINAGEVRLQRAVLLTDGHANAGITDHAELAHHAGVLRRTGITTSVVGVGHGYDERLSEEMARAGGGRVSHVTDNASAREAFAGELAELAGTVLSNIALDLRLPHGLSLTLLNQFPFTVSGSAITITPRDLQSGTTLDLLLLASFTGHGTTAEVSITGFWRGTHAITGQSTTGPIQVPSLQVVPPAEVQRYPVNPTVSVLRTMEETLRDQREALRLDREHDFGNSRAIFANIHQRLASAAGLAEASNLDASMTSRLVSEQSRVAQLAAAPAMELDEEVHKERAAFRSRTSRGQQRA
jgi:Ca-activated chloride channel family protein